MATSGSPFEGRDNRIVPKVYVAGELDIRLYTNTANSLSSTTVLADLTQPAGSGSADITLSGNWSGDSGVVTYDSDPTWTAGADFTGGAVTGVAVTDGTYILHFMDLSLGPITFLVGPPATVLTVDLSTFISV